MPAPRIIAAAATAAVKVLFIGGSEKNCNACKHCSMALLLRPSTCHEDEQYNGIAIRFRKEDDYPIHLKSTPHIGCKSAAIEITPRIAPVLAI
jgi:hypothetical protein